MSRKIHCDGLACEETAPEEDVMIRGSWLKVEPMGGIEVRTFSGLDDGPFHFHSLRCLLRWTNVQLTSDA